MKILNFKTKGECTKYVRKIYKEIGLTDDLERDHPEHYDFLVNQLFVLHPEADEKLDGLKRVSVEKHPSFGTQYAKLWYDHKAPDDISYLHAISGKKRTLHGDKMVEYRERIVHQTRAYTRDPCCKRCGSSVALHTDHIYPFSRIVKDFEESNHTDWEDYHRRIARYQTLCRDCNLQKGASIPGA